MVCRVVFYGAMVVFVLANFWYVIVTFNESLWWGLGCLLVPLVSLVFLLSHWSEAKAPFLTSLAAAGVAFVAMLGMGGMGAV